MPLPYNQKPKKRGCGRTHHLIRTLWATEIPVSVTEIPVAHTVSAQPPLLPRFGEGHFRPSDSDISIVLTIARGRLHDSTPNCQNQPPHACAISARGGRGCVSRPFSRLTNVKRRFAHCPRGAARRCRPLMAPGAKLSSAMSIDMALSTRRDVGRDTYSLPQKRGCAASGTSMGEAA